MDHDFVQCDAKMRPVEDKQSRSLMHMHCLNTKQPASINKPVQLSCLLPALVSLFTRVFFNPVPGGTLPSTFQCFPCPNTPTSAQRGTIKGLIIWFRCSEEAKTLKCASRGEKQISVIAPASLLFFWFSLLLFLLLVFGAYSSPTAFEIFQCQNISSCALVYNTVIGWPGAEYRSFKKGRFCGRVPSVINGERTVVLPLKCVLDRESLTSQ